MNKYIKMFMDDNNLKEGESFKIKYFDNEFWFDSYGYLNSKIKDDYNNLTCMLLSGDVQVEKLSPIPTERFIPKENERFWFVNNFGFIDNEVYVSDTSADYCVRHNLVFRTKEEVKDYKWFLDKVDEYKKPFELEKDNHYFYYNHEDEKVYRIYDIYRQGQGIICFGNKENIEKFIEEVGEERIKKYMFDIWQR